MHEQEQHQSSGPLQHHGHGFAAPTVRTEAPGPLLHCGVRSRTACRLYRAIGRTIAGITRVIGRAVVCTAPPTRIWICAREVNISLLHRAREESTPRSVAVHALGREENIAGTFFISSRDHWQRLEARGRLLRSRPRADACSPP